MAAVRPDRAPGRLQHDVTSGGHPRRFAGVVLTGGASRRMGRDKAFIEIDGRAMVRIAADALRDAGALTVHCVGGDVARLAALGLSTIADRYPGEGPLGGLLSAFGEAPPGEGAGGGEATVVVLTCDLPHVDASVVRALVDTLHQHPDAAVAAPRLEGRLQLLTAAYRPRLVRPHAAAAFARGDRAVRAALDALTVAEVHGIASQRLVDADTPDMLPGAATDSTPAAPAPPR